MCESVFIFKSLNAFKNKVHFNLKVKLAYESKIKKSHVIYR